MTFFEWDKKFEIGVPEMDNQHKKWVEIINRFYDHLINNDINKTTKIMINEVIDYTNYHFSEEEKLMMSIGYPHINDQKEMHNKITEKMKYFKNRIDEGILVVSTSITNEMKLWLKDHIMVEDKKYAVLYKKKN